MKYALLLGDFETGVEVVGEFEEASDASAWARTHCPDGIDYQVLPLRSADSYTFYRCTYCKKALRESDALRLMDNKVPRCAFCFGEAEVVED